MELSKRLYAVAGLVTEGASVADIGTDHGYIPIYLVQQKIASKAIAMDINEGPLERARIHIADSGLSNQIETRMSDGLLAVTPGEVDTMIAAGMGGGLIMKILEEGRTVAAQLKYFILQPQSEIARVRKYLLQNNMKVIREDMVVEDGKYYPMMLVIHGEDTDYSEEELEYGRELLKSGHPVLLEYLKREKRIRLDITEKLEKNAGTHSKLRLDELKNETEVINRALKYYK